MGKNRNFKKDEFSEFIATIKEEQIAHWENVAEAIGVARSTIQRWRELPEAQDAITIGITRTLEQMENAGKKDWRMWAEKLKMLGVNPPQKIQAEVSDSRKIILDKYGLGEGYAGQAETTES